MGGTHTNWAAGDRQKHSQLYAASSCCTRAHAHNIAAPFALKCGKQPVLWALDRFRELASPCRASRPQCQSSCRLALPGHWWACPAVKVCNAHRKVFIYAQPQVGRSSLQRKASIMSTTLSCNHSSSLQHCAPSALHKPSLLHSFMTDAHQLPATKPRQSPDRSPMLSSRLSCCLSSLKR